jgi:hypothetical protein
LVIVKILSVQGVVDPYTGEEGKRVEFVVERPTPPRISTTPEAAVVREAIEQLSALGLPIAPPTTKRALPKIVLYLTEDEAEALGISLDVNRRYDVKFENGKLVFREVKGEAPGV